MAERSEAVEEQAVRDGSATYSVEPEAATSKDVPPGYKRTEVGVIPEEWQVRTLKGVAPLQRGFDLPSSQLKEGPYPVVFSNGIWAYHANSMVRGPGVVTGRSGTLGRVQFITDSYWPHNTTLWVTSFKNNEPLYIYYLYQKLGFERFQSGSGVPTLNRNDAHSHLVCVAPTRSEQRAIATALSDADALIESLDRLIAKKRAIKQSAMQQLLTGQTRLPGFTGEWETKRLGDLFTIRVTTSKARHITHGGQFLIVDMGSVSRSGQLIASKPTNYQGDYLAKGELVMPKDDIGGGGIIGKVAFIDANHRYILGDHVYALTIKEGNPRFFSYQINSYEVNTALRSKVSGSAQLGLARTAVLEQELHTPAAEEQTAIATVLSDMDTEIEALERRRDKARQIKQGMMQQLLTGRVRLV